MPPADAPAELWVLVCGCEPSFLRVFFEDTLHIGVKWGRDDCRACHQRPRLVRYERSEKP